METADKFSRNRGRSARKRLRKQFTAGSESVNGEQFRQHLQQLPPELAAEEAGSLLSQAQEDVLAHYLHRLRAMSTGKSAESIWNFLQQHEAEAEQLGLIEQLRASVWEAAARLTNPRMLRLTQRYSQR